MLLRLRHWLHHHQHPTGPPQNKKAKFEDRYNTEETSDADVLGELSIM
jgi:hypothetical protein